MARKAGARAFTVAYRLAPQYPFPCALMDCLSAYLYLTEPHDPVEAPLHQPVSPKKIIIAGDSAGGNLALSLLCVLRNLGKELPLGAVLISPWVDLTHSFESVMDNSAKDILRKPGEFIHLIWFSSKVIPSAKKKNPYALRAAPHGFIYQPSDAWPPPAKTPPSSGPSSEIGALLRLACQSRKPITSLFSSPYIPFQRNSQRPDCDQRYFGIVGVSSTTKDLYPNVWRAFDLSWSGYISPDGS